MPSFLLGLAFVVLWSSGFIGAALSADSATVPAVLAWRYAVTALILLGALLTLRIAHRVPRTAPAPRELGRQVVLGLLAHVVYICAVYGAVGAGVSAGTAALVAALQPIVVVVAGRVVWGDAVGGRQWVGLLVGVVAVGLTVGGAVSGAGVATLLPVLALVALSGAALLERRWQPTTGLLVSLTVQVVTAAVVFATWATLTGAWGEVVSVRAFLPALAWQVGLAGLGGYAAFVLSLRRLGASTTSTLLYLTPPVTTLWAWAMLGERPVLGEILGLLLGGVAVALVLAGRRRPSPDQPSPDQPGPDQPGPDQPGPDQPGPDQPGPDRQSRPATARAVLRKSCATSAPSR